jgi:hypothetical protein
MIRSEVASKQLQATRLWLAGRGKSAQIVAKARIHPGNVGLECFVSACQSGRPRAVWKSRAVFRSRFAPSTFGMRIIANWEMIGFPGYVPYYYPSDILDDYKGMIFLAQGGSVSISVNRYRNNDPASHPTPADGGTQDALVIKESLRQLDSGNILARAGGAVSYVDVFTGKGSPEAIGAVLQCFADYSDQFISRYSNDWNHANKKCAAFLADPNTSWQDTLQAICDEYIGLDCNGFVGNWLRKRDRSLGLGPQQDPHTVYNRRKIVRSSVDEVQYCDIVVWRNFSHVAAINLNGDANNQVSMCQSAGGGPRMNDYFVHRLSDGVFTLSGGIPAKDVPGAVYIISLWPE